MPVRSMTGFGQAGGLAGASAVKVEIRTVNHRFAEFSVRMPRDVMALEETVRACLAEHIGRGRADVFVSVDPSAQEARQVSVDWALFDALREMERAAISRAGVSDDVAARPAEWLKYPDVLRVASADLNVDDMRAGMVQVVRAACVALVEMREREGARLAEDLSGKAADLAIVIESLKGRAAETVSAHRERLQRRLSEFGVDVDEQRMMAEVAVFAERAAIDEELVRLDSHVAEFRQSVAAGSPVGRRLDFIIQEMQRELNTIASKAANLDVSKLVVDAKALVEQLREQVQNVE